MAPLTHGRKFLQPLHHFTSIFSSICSQTVTSHCVHTPLFWRGMICVVSTSCLRRPAAKHTRSLPHMTQCFLPSARDDVLLLPRPLVRKSGKLTIRAKSGKACSARALRLPQKRFRGGCFSGTQRFKLEALTCCQSSSSFKFVSLLLTVAQCGCAKGGYGAVGAALPYQGGGYG